MAGLILLGEDESWSAVGWLFDWVLRVLADETGDADLAAELRGIVDRQTRLLDLSELEGEGAYEVRTLIRTRLLAVSNERLPATRDRRHGVLAQVAELVEQSDASDMTLGAVARRWWVRQSAVCDRFAVECWAPELVLKCGVSADIVGRQRGENAVWPVHGCRYPTTLDSTGWYIWTGRITEEFDFFAPAHVGELEISLPEAVPYLGLPPGWRFEIGPDHEQVWYDESLLEEEDEEGWA